MKKILYCTSVMVLIVILLPAIIVRSCGPAPVESRLLSRYRKKYMK